jgi:hypothetical protein
MWEYIGPRDPSVVVDDHLPKESMTEVAWMVLGSVSGELTVDGEPMPFLVFEPRPDDVPLLGEVSVPLALRDRGPRLPLGVLPRR